jgi:cytochrome c oxidase assembly factor CtaG
MSTKVVSSSLWIVAGVIGISTSMMYRVEPVPWTIAMVLGILAVLVGVVSLLRADARVASWPVGVGIAWVSCYLALAVAQLGDPAALITDIGLACFGVAAVVLGRRRAAAPV